MIVPPVFWSIAPRLRTVPHDLGFKRKAWGLRQMSIANIPQAFGKRRELFARVQQKLALVKKFGARVQQKPALLRKSRATVQMGWGTILKTWGMLKPSRMMLKLPQETRRI